MNDIDNFWHEFLKIQNQFTGNELSSDAMNHLLMYLEKIDPRLYYHTGSKDKGTDLILSAEGHADLMPIMEKIKFAAPTLENWTVVTAYDGLLLFGERNNRVFPSTENGDVLFRMASSGDKLWISRDVNFSVIFPTKENATVFHSKIEQLGMQSVIEKYDGARGFLFQVEVSKKIIPDHQTITTIENHLATLASPLNGRNDGWGCFEV
jgi:Regulator of ribonuclease activity B